MRTLYNAFAEHVARRRAILRAVTIEYVKSAFWMDLHFQLWSLVLNIYLQDVIPTWQICVFMDTLMVLGTSACLQKRSLRSFRSLSLESTMHEME